MTFVSRALIALFLLLPLQCALNPSQGIDLAVVRVVILAIFAFLVAYSLFRHTCYIPMGWHVAFFSLFAMYCIFSLFYSPQFFWTLRKILFLFSIFPLYYILIIVFTTVKNSHVKICQAIVCGATVIALVGITQFFLQFIFPLDTIISVWAHISPFFLGGTFSASVSTYNSWLVHVGNHDLMRAIAFFPDPHIFSFYLGLIIPLACGLYAKTHQKRWILLAIILVCGDLLTFSRGGYIALFGGCILAILFLWPILHTSLRHALFAGIVSTVFFFMIPHNPITQRFSSSFDLTDTSNTQRITLWKQASEHLYEKPLLGTGLGAYPFIIDPAADYRKPIYAHDLFLDVSVELGLIGGLLFFLIFARTIFIFYLYREDFFALFAIISTGIFLIHALFDTPLFSVHVLPILMFIFALASYYESSFKHTR